MAINKTIKMTWNGKDYNVLINMRVIDYIENHINLLKMVNLAQTSDLRLSHAANLIAILLNTQGADVTQEEVYEGIWGSADDENGPAQVIDLVKQILLAIFPEPKKKPVLQKRKRKAKN